MKPAPFELHRPTTLGEALAILGRVCDEGGLVLAGGQSLVPMMALRVVYPPHLVDINGIEPLSRIAVEDGLLTVGATVRHAAFHRPVVDGPLGHLLAEVSRHIAHYPIRKRGTFCGSLSHADPASEWCLVAKTLGARIHLASLEGGRVLEADAFFVGAMTTAREPAEIVVEARLPVMPGAATFGFSEFNRRAGDFALGMSLVTFEIVDGVVVDPRIGIGGIEEMPRRLPRVEAMLADRRVTDTEPAALAAAACEEVDPMEDATTTADYRRHLAGVVVARAVGAAVARQARKD
ncbi:MAG: FAD binding domain-containing protein [Rhodobacteraceae bacterium]|nr:FAD binding domain-containing protein [Paracoccaceae bacterium]